MTASAGKERPLDLLIGGAAKSGTTSLKEYLSRHPSVYTHGERGLNLFEEALAPSEFASAYDRYFPAVGEGGTGTVVVAKSVRVLYSEAAQDNLRHRYPGVHVALVLREPVGRAYSDYWYARRQGWERASSFRAALEAGPERFPEGSRERERCAYLDRSLYAVHLRRLLERFPPERVHVHLLEELHTAPEEVVTSLMARLGHPETGVSLAGARRHNSAALPRSRAVAALLAGSGEILGPARRLCAALVPDAARDRLREGLRGLNEREFTPPPLEADLRERLDRYFAPHNAELEELLGRSLGPAWSVERAGVGRAGRASAPEGGA